MWAEIEQWALKKLNRLATRRNFYTYDDITLKLYLEIARTGKVSLLAKRKLIIPLETIYSLWEEIVRRNAEANEDNTYQFYQDIEQSYGMLLSEYTALKVTVTMLSFRYKPEDVEFMAERGYPLRSFRNSAEYADALSAVSRKVESLTTRITMNRKQLQSMQNDDRPKEFPTLEKLLAQISVELPFEVREDITLARFNEYKKLITEKHKVKRRESQYGRDQ